MKMNHPLSFGQQRLWFLSQLDPTNWAYNEPLLLQIKGEIEVKHLEGAINDLIDRHESLRTIFIESDGLGSQSVLENHEIKLTLEKMTVQQTELELKSWFELPFNFQAGPPVRVRLIQTTESSYCLAFNFHHIICDGWSFRIFIEELKVCYEARLNEKHKGLEPLTSRYVDFVKANLQVEKHLDYADRFELLLNCLSKTEPLLIPSGRSRSGEINKGGGSLRFCLSAEKWDIIQSFSSSQESMPFSVMFAAYQLLLWKYTGQRNFCVGSPSASRSKVELEKIFGFFANTLPIVCEIVPTTTVSDFIRKVHFCTFTGFANEDIPFEKLVEALNPERNLSSTPVFQVMFNKHVSLKRHFKMGNSEVRVPITDFNNSKVDLSLAFEELEDGGVSCELLYATSFLDSAMVRNMPDQLISLLDQMRFDPSKKISELSIIEEKDALDANPFRYLSSVSLDEQFSAICRRFPERIALVCEGQTMTYAEVNSRSDKIASYLQSINLESEAVVGIALRRSIDSIVSLIGVLKAGACYLPLDLDEPEIRLKEKLVVSKARAIISFEDLFSRFNLPTLDLNHLHEFTFNPILRKNTNQQNQTAYILFTSGSTGSPKAVVVEHGNISHYTAAVSEKLREITGYDLCGLNFATISTLTADLGNTCIFSSLANGGTLHILNYETATDSKLFETYMRDHSIDVLKIVPSHFSALMQTSLALPRRLLIFGGDYLTSSLVQKIYQLEPTVLVCNHYGPTETCVGSLMTELPKEMVEQLSESASMPLGRPLGNTVLLVLDSQKKPVPHGAIGELYIGGPGVSRGYLNDSEMTRLKFIKYHGQRFYRTGDFVRKSQNHNYYFQGRRDDQLKIRGFRVELAEVENGIRSLPEVADVALIISREAGLASLVAFVEPANLVTKTLYEKLHSVLPAHMVPQKIVSTEKILKNQNGKIDRKLLEKLIESNNHIKTSFNPVDAIEISLSKIWKQLIGHLPTSREESFFAAGGHSLLAIQIVNRLKNELGVHLPVKKIFQFPRFLEIAENLRALNQETLKDKDTNKKTDETSDQITSSALSGVSSSQERLWFLFKFDPINPFYNEPIGLRLIGDLRIDLLEEAIKHIQIRHEQLRGIFREQKGRLFCEIGPSPEVKLNLVLTSEENIEVVAKQFFSQSFNFDKPLFRTQLLKTSEKDHTLLICVHHIVCDGWSMDILISDLAHIYNSLSDDKPISLKPIPSYSEFVQKQSTMNWRQSIEAVVDRLQLTETLNLPTDYLRPSIQKHRGHSVQNILSDDLAQRLNEFALSRGVTLFQVMLTAFEILLYRYSGQSNFAIGIPMANRVDQEFENTLGMFVNTVAINADVSDDSFDLILKKVCETVYDAIENQGIPFEQVVQKLNPNRNLSHSPIFQVLFNYSVERDLPKFNDLKINRFSCDLGVAKFDLSLGVKAKRSGQIICEWETDSDLFNLASTQRFADHFNCLLESLVHSPELRADQLRILSANEELRILKEWNNTAVDYGPFKSIHEVIETTCQEHPNRIALSFEVNEISYSELAKLSSKIVTALQKIDIMKNDLVGIMMDRSIEMVVSLVGILKAGAAYIPIDPNYPIDRVEYMLEDSSPKVLLTQRKFETLSKKVLKKGMKIIFIEEELPHLEVSHQNVIVEPEDSAYMIYTSGSTGRPKGAINSHAGIYNRLMWMQQQYCLNETDVVLQKTPFSFDVSVWEFFWPLMFGAKLVIARPEGHKDPSYLVNLIRQSNVTTIHFVPSMLHAFLSYDETEKCTSLRRVISSGEALSYDLQTKFFSIFQSTELHNLYGPTEAAVDVTYWACNRNEKRGIVPIGRPIANTQIYILDKNRSPVPIGVAGELFIGGIGVGKGYFNKPELTNEKFVDDLFTNKKMYRTGDRARFLPDGSIEYLGRLDNQVKLRGFRIELGEIEVAISDLPAVARNIVVISDTLSQQKELVAYIVLKNGSQVDADTIISHLRKQLPDHMVPTAYMFIDSVPISPSGKVDFKKLPKPSRPVQASLNKKPSEGVETEVALIWSNVLGHSNFGSEDSFFDVGGNSLLLLQVQSRLNQVFSKKIELMELFRAPTVVALAKSLVGTFEASTSVIQSSVADRREGLSRLSSRRRP